MLYPYFTGFDTSFSLLFSFKYFMIPIVISSLTHRLLLSTLCSLQIFGYFLVFTSDFYLNSTVVKKHTLNDFSSLKFVGTSIMFHRLFSFDECSLWTSQGFVLCVCWVCCSVGRHQVHLCGPFFCVFTDLVEGVLLVQSVITKGIDPLLVACTFLL